MQGRHRLARRPSLSLRSRSVLCFVTSFSLSFWALYSSLTFCRYLVDCDDGLYSHPSLLYSQAVAKGMKPALINRQFMLFRGMIKVGNIFWILEKGLLLNSPQTRQRRTGLCSQDLKAGTLSGGASSILQHVCL